MRCKVIESYEIYFNTIDQYEYVKNMLETFASTLYILEQKLVCLFHYKLCEKLHSATTSISNHILFIEYLPIKRKIIGN